MDFNWTKRRKNKWRCKNWCTSLDAYLIPYLLTAPSEFLQLNALYELILTVEHSISPYHQPLPLIQLELEIYRASNIAAVKNRKNNCLKIAVILILVNVNKIPIYTHFQYFIHKNHEQNHTDWHYYSFGIRFWNLWNAIDYGLLMDKETKSPNEFIESRNVKKWKLFQKLT